MKNVLILIFAVLISMQCFAQGNKKLKVDETAKMIFTATELKGIKEMIQFVDDAVADSTNAADINQAYHSCFDKLALYLVKGDFLPSLFKDSIKFKYLETIDKTAFDAIWRIDDYVRMVRYRDTILTDLYGFTTLILNYQGKYISYLKKLGKSDSHYAYIHNQIEIAGEMSAAFYSWVPMYHQEFDFTLFKDRLWATVFLLSLDDPFEEKVERYLKGKNN
jgi:hypothetical protein